MQLFVWYLWDGDDRTNQGRKALEHRAYRVYRALEAHFSMYLALKKLYMKKFIDDHLEIEKDLREAVTDAVPNVPEYSKENKDIIRHKTTKMFSML